MSENLLDTLPTLDDARKMFASHERTIGESVLAIESVPRLGFTSHGMSVLEMSHSLGIKAEWHQGAYWSQVLTRAIESAIKRGYLYVLCVDYDSLFTSADVAELYRIVHDDATIDALCAVQVARDNDAPLMCHTDSRGMYQAPITREAIERETIRLKTAHFGLTLLRASSFEHLGKPWFMPVPDADGGWGIGRQDDDIAFWTRWWDCGNTLYQANRVSIGHAQLMVSWPDKDLKPIHQYMGDYQNGGKPKETLNYKEPDNGPIG